VATTDLLVQGRHFRSDWSTAQDIGVKAAAQNLADIAAMGAAPVALLLGLALPGSTEAEWILGVVAGLAEEGARAGAVVAGGDVTSADQVVLAVTALGDLAGREPVTRSGARPGEQVAVHGRLGWSAAGLALLAAGAAAEAASLADLVAAHLRPCPDYLAGVEAATAGASAMIDVSDGLVQDLRHVAGASGVRLELSTAQLPDPGPLLDAAEVLGADWRTWALAGGEDHALAATFPAGASLPAGWRRIGAVRPGRGVVVDGADYPGSGGWQHFS
jgi:thiamine-monophosphate kinase